ncbi:hypothetical protein QJS10_CPA02g00739 [Acorus calamus]|uniref:T-complex protein 11 n=1 Tax=Acorus calamus TaxID=4465 RepID=A0AAV9FE93_ACOCL|nr:hypothetical protein QJS10_CPA02g00739 [Acorus calamus]
MGELERTGVAMEFPATTAKEAESSTPTPPPVPRRLRRRLEREAVRGPHTAEEIESKLKEADLRRQQFHEWLSSKARPKPRSPTWSLSQVEDLGQRLEAKLEAAEQKRLSILAEAQMRLARLDKLRQEAKTEVELRCEKEREELVSKVESRVQQAEANRKLLLKAYKQRRAAAQERKAQLLLQRVVCENKYKECVRSAIYQKRAAAEKKRLGILEAERTRAHARVAQVQRVAKSVYHQRETERRRMKDQLEDRLQRAKRQRAEYLRQRGSPQSSMRLNWNKHGDFLSRKLARCWRRFVESRRTTFSLAKAFESLEIDENLARVMPFEQLAIRIGSSGTLQTVKAFLDRLESRLTLMQSGSLSGLENIDHLLKRLVTPKKRVGSSGNGVRTRSAKKGGSSRELRRPEANKLSRYSVRVVLCAYMILSHPDAVFSGRGEREIALSEAALKFVQEFELLVKIILDGPSSQSDSSCSSRQSSPDRACSEDDHELESIQSPAKLTFRSQLVAFDAAWRSYLYSFVVWKMKDAKSLEEDLVRAACQMELSMMRKCKLTPQGDSRDLSHDMKAIKQQVSNDQKLLRESILHLSGSAGIIRMEHALSDMRTKYFEEQDNGTLEMSPVAQFSLLTSPDSSPGPSSSSAKMHVTVEDGGNTSHVVRSLFKDASSSSDSYKTSEPQRETSVGEKLVTQNETLVNEIVHANRAFSDGFDVNDEGQMGIKAKIKVTMEKAFWDEVTESMKKDDPDYGRLVGLVKEVRDELCEMAPKRWKQEIVDSIDLDILSQVLKSGIPDMDYLGRILKYSLGMLQKLCAPADEEEFKKTHEKLLNELADIAHAHGKVDIPFVIAVIKGLRFVLEQIQTLKKEISKARIQMMEPYIKGPAGFEYLQKAFADRYGPSSNATSSLPLTAQWLSSVQNSANREWEEHSDSLSVLTNEFSSSSSLSLPSVVLRSGGSISPALKQSLATISASSGIELQECKGEQVDLLVRLGLLKLVSKIEGLTEETLPETLKLNFSRLRLAQSQFQKAIVISTSVLVLRQILVSLNIVSQMDIESIATKAFKNLSNLLDRNTDAGVPEIIELLCSISPEKLEERKQMMANLLLKSLQAGDPVFVKISQALYLAVRGVVLGGGGAGGKKLAETALRRVGAGVLLSQVVELAKTLIVVAMVSHRVHGPWYGGLVGNV